MVNEAIGSCIIGQKNCRKSGKHRDDRGVEVTLAVSPEKKVQQKKKTAAAHEIHKSSRIKREHEEAG